jgi:FO synthase
VTTKPQAPPEPTPQATPEAPEDTPGGTATREVLERARRGILPARAEALALADCHDLAALIGVAGALRDAGHGRNLSYSRKVFLPLTHLCRDICHYCVFAQPPKPGEAAYLSRDRLLAAAEQGARAGCKEALFTLGDKPELRWQAARDGLAELGHDTTLSYLREAAELVLRETGLLPHLNPGLMTAADLAALRPHAPSMGIMLESVSPRLLEKGNAHYGCPDKDPAARLETIRLAGEARIPFTSGILIGIGETRRERIEALLALRDLHADHGHLQEVIVQNFRAKPDTRMAESPEPDLADLVWTIAVARIVLGAQMNLQAPPNLSPGALRQIVAAGINDWGGVSPVTPDFVNPEAPWPHLDELRRETEAAGLELVERLTIYPEYALDPERWLDPALRTPVLRAIDSEGFARTDDWVPGEPAAPPAHVLALVRQRSGVDGANGVGAQRAPSAEVASLLERARAGERLGEAQIVRLFAARGADLAAVCRAADALRREVCGDQVTYVVNRNINYTNVCYFKCQFCAFSKGKLSENLRGKPYDLELGEIARRTQEAWERGATEVCMQGGIHPDYTGDTYLEIVRTVKEAVPGIHVHAFSPLEVWQGAATLDLPLADYLERLLEAGLGTLPGTAAEVLDDEVRAVLCPDKLRTDQWLEVMETAHRVGFRTTATIMYGHVEHPRHWARHLLRVRALQERTGGFTELVPLPFVHMEAPIYLKGRSRRGPTFREAILVHAVARLALHPVIANIQASWVKMGPEGVAACLDAGVNDLGGTLMNESITRAAGAAHGQEMPPTELEALIRSCGRVPRQRSTAYGPVDEERRVTSFAAAPLAPIVNNPARRYERSGPAELIRPGLG